MPAVIIKSSSSSSSSSSNSRVANFPTLIEDVKQPTVVIVVSGEDIEVYTGKEAEEKLA